MWGDTKWLYVDWLETVWRDAQCTFISICVCLPSIGCILLGLAACILKKDHPQWMNTLISLFFKLVSIMVIHPTNKLLDTDYTCISIYVYIYIYITLNIYKYIPPKSNLVYKNPGISVHTSCHICPTGQQAPDQLSSPSSRSQGSWQRHPSWLFFFAQLSEKLLPLKNISQNGNLPQVGVKIKNIWNHHLD